MSKRHSINCTWKEFNQFLTEEFNYLKKRIFESAKSVTQEVTFDPESKSQEVEVVCTISESTKTKLGIRNIKISYTLNKEQIIDVVTRNTIAQEKLFEIILKDWTPTQVVFHQNGVTMNDDDIFLSYVLVKSQKTRQ